MPKVLKIVVLVSLSLLGLVALAFAFNIIGVNRNGTIAGY